MTRIDVEDSALVKNMLLFQNRDPHPVDLSEFASILQVTVEDSSLVSLFKMHLEVSVNYFLTDQIYVSLKRKLINKYIDYFKRVLLVFDEALFLFLSRMKIQLL